MNDLAWIWKISSRVHEGTGLVITSRRLRYFAQALLVYGALKPFMHAPRPKSLGKLMTQRQETVGVVIWPYQCLDWDACTRLNRIRDHYSIIDSLGGPIDFPVNDRLVLLDLGEIREDLQIVLDQPKWFMREGQLTINLFLGDLRLYSLVFSLGSDAEGVAAFVGAIQGRDLEGILEEYRALTKAAHGMRPRDLLIEAFRMFCRAIGVARIYAVADEHRQHRSPYYGPTADKKLNLNYDEVWKERRGVRVDRLHFQLDVNPTERDLESIPAKKRGMYRRRYEMLRKIDKSFRARWSALAKASTSRET